MAAVRLDVSSMKLAEAAARRLGLIINSDMLISGSTVEVLLPDVVLLLCFEGVLPLWRVLVCNVLVILSLYVKL